MGCREVPCLRNILRAAVSDNETCGERTEELKITTDVQTAGKGIKIHNQIMKWSIK